MFMDNDEFILSFLQVAAINNFCIDQPCSKHAFIRQGHKHWKPAPLQMYYDCSMLNEMIIIVTTWNLTSYEAEIGLGLNWPC